ncbi:acyl carrier protein [Streptomyces albireticuli]|uniref:Acyl carrier protein n=1 Tax=Streptomyces albireticuli TaxID=1940 RepID=A0A2A2D3E7_9ACTN|nr:acyl carrier protein [Streptomyces albireticuli]MCD9144895.1 acyl carrier protein [Streptomyces albireticuli]MCD9164321.1 acyl carrier protein [Streptomyces albireticuli]MCD9194032.1 acyl carrier protein [Streptomyces albireticuli]PAU45929.1 acyl carrier protein [Streptomyces albireticuli]
MSEAAQPPFAYIRDYLASVFGLSADELTGDRTFGSLELDSIAQVEMFVTLSDHYGVQLDDSLACEETTLQQTADLVSAALEGGDRPEPQDAGAVTPS